MSFEESYEVVGIERRTPTIVELSLRPVAGTLAYLPGEYVLLEDHDHNVLPRSYSVANAPRTDGVISLLVTRAPGGQTSTWVHDCLRVGHEVSISAPYGSFVDDPTATAPALFLAAGSGLAPIRSLIEAVLWARARPSSTLIFSARTESDVIDGERFRRWDAERPGFRFIRTLTRGVGSPPRGRIPDLLPALCGELSAHDIFIAGAPGFVLACAAAVEARGARAGHVHTEVSSSGLRGEELTTRDESRGYGSLMTCAKWLERQFDVLVLSFAPGSYAVALGRRAPSAGYRPRQLSTIVGSRGRRHHRPGQPAHRNGVDGTSRARGR